MDQTTLNNAALSNEAYTNYTQNDIGKNVTVNGQTWTVYAVSGDTVSRIDNVRKKYERGS